MNPHEAEEIEAALQRLAKTSRPSRFVIIAGKIGRFLFILGVLTLIWFFGPDAIGDRPLGSVTFKELFNQIFYIALCGGCIWWLYRPISDVAAATWTALFAVVLILGTVVLVIINAGS